MKLAKQIIEREMQVKIGLSLKIKELQKTIQEQALVIKNGNLNKQTKEMSTQTSKVIDPQRDVTKKLQVKWRKMSTIHMKNDMNRTKSNFFRSRQSIVQSQTFREDPSDNTFQPHRHNTNADFSVDVDVKNSSHFPLTQRRQEQ